MEKAALLERLQSRAGQKCIKLLLYLGFFVLHLAISSAAYLPSIDPNEFTAAALANLFTGIDWTAAMSRSDYFYGFLQALLYVPVVFLVKDPFLQYQVMIAVNGLVMSFVPVIVYSCSRMLGLEKMWHSVLAAICCGGWMTYMMHSNFIWNETAAMFLPWLTLWLLLRADKAEKKSVKTVRSVLLAITAALSYCAHERLFALIAALALTVILLRVIFKRKCVNMPAFFITLGIFFAGAVFANYLVQSSLWEVDDPALLNNTAEHFFAALPATLERVGMGRFFTSLASQFFYFISASWGLGALGISFFLSTTVWCIRDARKKEKLVSTPRTLLMTFTVLLTLFTLFISVCYRFGAENFESAQSTVLFGRYIDAVIPFTVLFVLVFLHTARLTLVKIAVGIITSAVAYIGFFFTGRGTVLTADYTTVSPILGLYPVMFGESTAFRVTSTGLTAAISCTLCVMAVMLVIVSCADRLKNIIITCTVAAAALYSLGFGSLYYLPLSYAESVDKNGQYVEVSELLYNTPGAPPVTVYRGSRGCVMMVQYLNQNITVYTADNPDDIRRDTYIIVPDGVSPPFSEHGEVPMIPLGSTEEYSVFAYGERAGAYAHSQSGGGEETAALQTQKQ